MRSNGQTGWSDGTRTCLKNWNRFDRSSGVFFSNSRTETVGYSACDGVCFDSRSERIFVETYNGSGNEALLAVVAVPGISNLRVINTPNSSTPAASPNISFIINYLQAYFNFVQ